MDKVRVALIGAGGMANGVHYPSISSFEDVKIVGLCDLNEERLHHVADRFNIAQIYGDHQRMLDETKPDAAYVLMPPHVLYDAAMDVLERGCHLFIEKPPGVTTFQAECLAKAAEDKQLVTAVGFQRRYHPLVQRCWQEVKKKGPLHQVVATFYKDKKPGPGHPYYRGAIDICHTDVIHVIDAMRYYAGLPEVRSVASEVRKIDSWYAVSFNALVYFENDAVGVLLANWRTGRRFLRFEFHACDATAFADTEGDGSVWMDGKTDPVLHKSNVECAGSEELYILQGFCAENRAFIDAVKSGIPPHNSLPDAVKSMQLADMICANAINR